MPRRRLGYKLGPFGITVDAATREFRCTRSDYERQWRGHLIVPQARIFKCIAMHSPGTPEDIAHAMIFFASDQLSDDIGRTPG